LFTALLTEIFEVMDDNDLVADETFNKWYGTDLSSTVPGYSVAHESVGQFFVWLSSGDGGDEGDKVGGVEGGPQQAAEAEPDTDSK
jgi:hypothetical protein